MLKKTVALFLLLVFAGCTFKVPLYAPRRHRTEEHMNAKKTSDCLDCHDVEKKKDHKKDEDCFKCHKLCEGC